MILAVIEVVQSPKQFGKDDCKTTQNGPVSKRVESTTQFSQPTLLKTRGVKYVACTFAVTLI